MASSPTTRNSLAKQGTGDNSGSWGSVLNTQVFDLVDEALDGFVSVVINGNVTLSSTNYVTNQARNRMLKFTGTGGFTVTIPGVQKHYIIHNASSGAVTVKTASGVGASIAAGAITGLYCDGTDCSAYTNTGSSTFTTPIIGPAATTTQTSLRLPHGTDPTSPTDGDLWTTTTGVRARINGSTVDVGRTYKVAGGTISSASSVNITNLPSNMSALHIYISGLLPATTNTDFWVRVSNDNGATFNSAASYNWSRVTTLATVSGTATVGGTAGLSDTKYVVAASLNNAASQFFNARITLLTPKAGAASIEGAGFYIVTGASGASTFTFTGSTPGIAAVNAVRLLMSSGNVASGNYSAFVVTE